jgi:hypothetical protein
MPDDPEDYASSDLLSMHPANKNLRFGTVVGAYFALPRTPQGSENRSTSPPFGFYKVESFVDKVHQFQPPIVKRD